MNGTPDIRSTIVWDDTRARSTRPDVWEVTATMEEIAIVFGTLREPDGALPERHIAWTDRIVMSPFVIRRMALALEQSIREYESRYGLIADRLRSPAEDDSVRPSADRTSDGGAERVKDKAGMVYRLAKGLGIELGFERSFKVFEKNLLANRFLLGGSIKGAGDKLRQKMLDVCAQMHMPSDFLESFQRHLPEANCVHFGFEKNEKAWVYKAYLEFYDMIEEGMRAGLGRTAPHPLHLGFKWDLSDNSKKVLTRYTWHPFLSFEGMARELSGVFDPGRHKACIEIAQAILSIASRRVSHRDILYLEVEEEGNPRKSFDLNVYRAGLELAELCPFLDRICAMYSIPAERFRTLYERSKEKSLGHLSGGIDREGRDFLTVYYGVESVRDRVDPSGTEAPPETRKIGTPPLTRGHDFLGVERTDRKAGLLFDLVKRLPVKSGLERSFKVFDGAFLADRFLLGFKSRDIGRGSFKNILDICRRIDMPQDFLDAFQNQLPESNIVLFGFEANEENRLYKAYLEFGRKVDASLTENPGKTGPFPIHAAFKWDALDNTRKTTGEYVCFPGFTLQDMLERLAGRFCPGVKATSGIVEGILRLAAGRADPREFIYFEANEPDNPRTSFDVNLYRAGLRMKEIYPFLLDIMRCYSIPDWRFHNLYGAFGPLILGHLTGGVDRRGRDFLTVYYGEKGSAGSGALRR